MLVRTHSIWLWWPLNWLNDTLFLFVSLLSFLQSKQCSGHRHSHILVYFDISRKNFIQPTRSSRPNWWNLKCPRQWRPRVSQRDVQSSSRLILFIRSIHSFIHSFTQTEEGWFDRLSFWVCFIRCWFPRVKHVIIIIILFSEKCASCLFSDAFMSAFKKSPPPLLRCENGSGFLIVVFVPDPLPLFYIVYHYMYFLNYYFTATLRNSSVVHQLNIYLFTLKIIYQCKRKP